MISLVNRGCRFQFRDFLDFTFLLRNKFILVVEISFVYESIFNIFDRHISSTLSVRFLSSYWFGHQFIFLLFFEQIALQGFSFLFYLQDFGHGVKAVAGLDLLVALRLEFADLGVELLDLVWEDAEMPSCWGWHPWWSYNLLSGLTALKRTLLPGYLLKRRLILNPISPLNPAFILLFSLL